MRTLFIVFLLCVAFMTNCQKKEEPSVKASIPSSLTLQAENEIHFLQDSVKKDPLNVAAWINLGNLLMDSARYPEAIEAYEKALELSPKNVDVRVDMGTCYRRVGNYERAAEEFRRSINIDPLHPFAHRNLGVVLAFDLHDKKRAIKEFEEYIRLSPDTPDSHQIRQLVDNLKSEPVR